MEKYVFVDIHSDEETIDEGGASRALAIRNYILNHLSNSERLHLPKTKLRILKQFAYLLFVKGKTLVYIYPQLGFDVFQDDFYRRSITKIWFLLIRKVLKKNKIVFDIADIKYEQAIDLEIYKYKHSRMEEVERELFALDAYYIFASSSMKEYAVEKYKIPIEKTDVCINGGNKVKEVDISDLDVSFDCDKFTCVYAGTLNKGRNIETMISSFPSSEKVRLILMGPEGEWIKNYNRSNIIYLGALPEDKAHYIVSKCDVGLIPYDDSKKYYNIAYPTKLSFYITAGIPILSTPVREFVQMNNKHEFGWSKDLSSWGNFIDKVDPNEVLEKKKIVDKVREEFDWEYIYQRNKFII